MAAIYYLHTCWDVPVNGGAGHCSCTSSRNYNRTLVHSELKLFAHVPLMQEWVDVKSMDCFSHSHPLQSICSTYTHQEPLFALIIIGCVKSAYVSLSQLCLIQNVLFK
jgi:hypothetical protein